MLVYKNINKFYDGSDYENYTPLTSDYLNSIISQIESNFNNLDNRLEIIENVISSDELNIKIANIVTCNVTTLNSINAVINNLTSDLSILKQEILKH